MSTASADPEEVIELSVRPGGRSDSWLAIIERRRTTIVFAAIVGALVGRALVHFLPRTYEASERLLIVPVDDPTVSHGTTGFEAANAALPLVVAVMRSNRVAEETVDRLRLDAAWGLPLVEAHRRMSDRLLVASDRKGSLVTISFEDRVPARAQAVVATIAAQATAISTKLWAERNREHRHKLEADLAAVGAQLVGAEEAFREFRERTHVVDLPAQIEATVQQAVALERLRIDKTLNLRFARAFGDGGAIEVQRGQHERQAAAVELEALRHGRAGSPLLPLDDLPRLELEHARLKRAVDEQTQRHGLLALKVSELVAAEARPGGLAEVIDPPTVPTRPSGPSTVKLMSAGAFVGALLAALMVLLLARRSRLTKAGA